MLWSPKILTKIECSGAKFSHGHNFGVNSNKWPKKIPRDALFPVRSRLPVARGASYCWLSECTSAPAAFCFWLFRNTQYCVLLTWSSQARYSSSSPIPGLPYNGPIVTQPEPTLGQLLLLLLVLLLSVVVVVLLLLLPCLAIDTVRVKLSALLLLLFLLLMMSLMLLLLLLMLLLLQSKVEAGVLCRNFLWQLANY